MEQVSEPQQDKEYILLDTCIIQHLGKSNLSLADALTEYLTTLTKKEKYKLAISAITMYENLHGLSGNKAAKAFDLLHAYEWKAVTTQVLFLASILGTLYHNESYDGIDMGDKIIAATALAESGLILTNNHKDYPPPFFLPERQIPISFKKGHYLSTIDFALYKPNFPLLARRIEELKSKSK